MDKQAVVFIISRNLIFALATMIVNLKHTNPWLCKNIIVYHSDLTTKDIKAIKKLQNNIQFIEYTYSQWISDHKVPESSLSQDFIERYSHLTYAKYKIVELLEYYNKVLYLDVDMLITGSLKELFESDFPVAWQGIHNFKDKLVTWKNIPKELSNQYLKEIDSFKYYIKPNAGLLYFTDLIDYKKALQDGKRCICDLMDYYSSILDELSITFMLGKQNIEPYYLDNTVYNVLPYKKINYNSKIIHFYSNTKPWQNDATQICFPKWTEYYLEAKNIIREQEIFNIQTKELGDNYVKLAVSNIWIKLLYSYNINIPNGFELDYSSFHDRILKITHCKYSNIWFEIKIADIIKGDFIVGFVIKDKYLVGLENIGISLKNIVDKFNNLEEMNANKINFHKNKVIYISTSRLKENEIEIALDFFSKIILEPLYFLD